MQKTLIVNHREAEELLTMESCITAMEETLRDVSAGTTTMLQRNMIAQENGNKFATMSSSLHQKKLAGCKVIMFPGAQAKKDGTNQGIVPIFSSETGAILAIVDAECITGVRTAATSAAASKVLARKEAKTLGILGAGRLGRMHIEAIRLIRDIQTVYVWDILPTAIESLCKHVQETYGLEAVACDTAREAVVDADIVCTVTQAKEPILHGEWLKAGAHVNAVGACTSNARELDNRAVQLGRIFVDKREAVLKDAGDLLIPMATGELTQECIVGEVGEILMGTLAGRRNEEEITVFESVGIAVEDLAAAWLIYEKARESELGVEVEL